MRCSSPVCSITSTVSVRSRPEHGDCFLQLQNTIEPMNTFTYRPSELSPLSDELKAEIEKIHFDITHLILLKLQGHYSFYQKNEVQEQQ